MSAKLGFFSHGKFSAANGVRSAPQQDARRLAAEGVPGYGDTAPVQTAGEAGNGGFQEIKLIEDALHVLDAETPDPWRAGIVGRKAHGPGVEMGGLNDRETVGSPEVGQRTIAVQRRTEAVREDDNGQFPPGRRS